MSFSATINQHLRSIGHKFGTALVLEPDNTLTLGYGDGETCTLTVQHDARRIALATPLASVHAATKSQLFKIALQLDLRDTAIPEGIVGYDAIRSELVLTLGKEAGAMDADALQRCLTDFLCVALQLRDAIAETARSDTQHVSSREAIDRRTSQGLAPDDIVLWA